MNLTDAIARLTDAWPDVSFSVECEVWSHVHHDGRQKPEVGWSIYHADRNRHYRASTLDAVLACAIPASTALSEAEATVGAFDVNVLVGAMHPCDTCGTPRPPGVHHICPEAFMAHERRLMGADSAEVPIP